ncbi:MAG: septum site-determining protein MinD [Clostridiales bacterium]|nr:septum site-determining protein MinD [Clostridiales bacterium]
MKSMVITSGKGGVGKTTVTACLGMALARQGFRVALMDADFGLNNLDVVLGLEARVVYDIVDVIENRCRVRQALVEADTRNLFLLPSAHGYLGERVTAQNLRLVLNSLAVTFDYALVDCPAGIEAGFTRAVGACDSALVVTTPHVSALRDANKVITLLSSYRIPCEVVVNRVRGDLLASGKIPSPGEIGGLLKCTVGGIIPETDGVYNITAVPRKPFDRLASHISGGSSEIVDPAAEYRGFWGRLKRKLKKESNR